MEKMSHEISQSNQAGLTSHLPDGWIEYIFNWMEKRYLNKWRDGLGAIPRDEMKDAWAEDLAGCNRDELRNGLAVCKQKSKIFPPNSLEFLDYCRPQSDTKADWAEAREQMRIRLQGRGSDVWSRPQVYWAAAAVGWYDLHLMPWEQIKTRWDEALTAAKGDEIPEYLAQLPAPGQQSISKEEAAKRVKELDAIVKRDVGEQKQWAVRIMGRVARKENVSFFAEKMARECLEESGGAAYVVGSDRS